MPRKCSSSSLSSSRTTIRPSSSAASSPFAKRTNQTASTSTPANQVAKPIMGEMGSGIMGSLMSGTAFGAGSEIVRGMFRNS